MFLSASWRRKKIIKKFDLDPFGAFAFSERQFCWWKFYDSWDSIFGRPASSGLFLGPRAFSGLFLGFWASSQPLLGLGPLSGLQPFWASGLFWTFCGLLKLFPACSGLRASGPLPSLFWTSGPFWAFSDLGPLLGFFGLLSLFPTFSGPGGLFWAFSKLLDLFPGLFPKKACSGFWTSSSLLACVLGSGLFWAFSGFGASSF